MQGTDVDQHGTGHDVAVEASPAQPAGHQVWPIGAMTVVVLGLLLASCGPPAGVAGHWSGPVMTADGATLVDVSCPTSSICVAVDGRATSTTLQGGVWSTPRPIAGSGPSNAEAPVAVSCSTPTFCVAATGDGTLPVYDGATWTNTPVVDGGNALASVSCTADRFCAAVDTSGQALTYDDGAPSAPATVDQGGSFASVSCVSPTFCLAVTADTPGTAYRFDGRKWNKVAAPYPSTPQGGSEPNVLGAVDCATSRYCVAIDTFGEAFTYDGQGWSAPATFDADEQNGNGAVSCPSHSFCMIVDDLGNAVAVVGRSLGPRWHVDSDSVGLNSVDCATNRRCVAVAPGGRVYTFTG